MHESLEETARKLQHNSSNIIKKNCENCEKIDEILEKFGEILK